MMCCSNRYGVWLPVICGLIVASGLFGANKSKLDRANETDGSAMAHDWPRWSGANSDLISTETDWSPDWKGELERAWSMEIGTGFSSVAVVGEKLCTMGRNEDQDVLFCLDRTTGKELWRFEYAAELFANMHEGGPGSTPTIESGRVFTLSRDGQVYCVDLETGKEQWRANLVEITGIKPPVWGYTSSAVPVGNHVCFEAGKVIAFDQETGKVAWTSEEVAKPGYGSVVPCEIEGRHLLATLNNQALVLLDAENGKMVAQHEWKTAFDTSSTSPIVIGDEIFVSTGYNRGCALFKFQGGKLSEIYSNKSMSNHMNNCVVIDGHLFGISGNSSESRKCKLTCMKWSTGEVAWAETGFGCGALMGAGNKLLVMSDAGELSCVDAATNKCKVLGKSKLFKGRCWTVPVLSGGFVYARSSTGDLVAVKLPAK